MMDRVELLEQVLPLQWEDSVAAVVDATVWAIERLPLSELEVMPDERHSRVTFWPSSPLLQTGLRACSASGGIRFAVISRSGERITATETELWREVAEVVVERVSSPEPTPWLAVIGPSPEPGHVLEPQEQRLARVRTARVGPLKLKSANTPMLEIEQDLFDFTRARLVRSWPIFVTGTSPRPHDWGVVAHVEGAQLRRLCCLLAVAWDKQWVLRRYPDAEAREVVTIPAFVGADRIPKEFDGDEPQAEPALVHVPHWLDDAWRVLDDTPRLVPVLQAHYEGVAIHRRNPSMALICFVSAIESLGKHLLRSKTLGSAASFRAAIDHMTDDTEQRSYLASAYASRSRTAHEGQLHGAEMAFGLDDAVFRSSPLAFELGISWDIRQASRRLVELAVRGRLGGPASR